MTLLSVVLALALAACGSDEPSGVTGPDRTASTPAATAPPAASGSAETDREALVALYNATGGKNWENSDNWLSGAPLGEWHGVIINDDGRVTNLGLVGNGLGGEKPAELGSLSNLTFLSFHVNGLVGEIPAELGNLSNLTLLHLNDNYLSGEIPAELGSLSNLTLLRLNDNYLSGEIPAKLGSLSNLLRLELAGNYQLSGCVPSSLEDRLAVSYFGDLVAFC